MPAPHSAGTRLRPSYASAAAAFLLSLLPGACAAFAAGRKTVDPIPHQPAAGHAIITSAGHQLPPAEDPGVLPPEAAWLEWLDCLSYYVGWCLYFACAVYLVMMAARLISRPR